MRIDEINPIGSQPGSPQQMSEPRVEPAKPVPPAAMPEDTFESHEGQLTLNGITAHFRVQQGVKVVYALIDDATGRVTQVSPEDMLPISGAIDEMLKYKRS